MRRGLMSWSRSELPEAVLDERVRKVQARMAAEGMSLLLAYTSFAQPAAAHWLCNFTPYWSEGMLAVRPSGLPVLLASMTPRVHPWMREVSRLEAVLSAPRLGETAIRYIEEHSRPGDTIGIVALDEMPASVMRPVADALGASRRFVDAAHVVDGCRHPCDEAELGLARRADAIARAALDTVPPAAARASDITPAIERSARMAGAEEVLLRMAPDLSAGTALQRIEGELTLGERFAVEASVAYKGVWVRCLRSFARGGEPEPWTVARRSFEQWAGGDLAGLRDAERRGLVDTWLVEAPLGLSPLAVVAGSGPAGASEVAAGVRGVLTVRANLPDGPWLAAAMLAPAGA